jgi:hypothetical protein
MVMPDQYTKQMFNDFLPAVSKTVPLGRLCKIWQGGNTMFINLTYFILSMVKQAAKLFRKVNVCLILILLYIIVPGLKGWADWIPDNGSLDVVVTQTANRSEIAVYNGTPFVTWREHNGTAWQVYVKYYNGSSWEHVSGAEESMNLDAARPSDNPDIAVALAGVPYVTWQEHNGTAFQIYVKHYNGSSWEQNGGSLNLDTNLSAENPRIAICNNTPYVVWAEYDGGTTYQIYAKHYTGSSWAQDGGSLNIALTQTGSNLSIAASAEGTPYVAWREHNGTVFQIYVKHFNGSSWEQNGGSLNMNVNINAVRPSIALSGSTPYVSWEEKNASINQIYVKHYTGSSWAQDGGSLNINTDRHANNGPSLAICNNTPYVAWSEQSSTFTYRVNVKHFTGSSWVQDGGSLNIDMNTHAEYPRIAVTDGIVYASWNEDSQVYVKHYVAFSPTATPTPNPSPPAADVPDGEVKAYPNPAKDKVRFAYPNQNNVEAVKINIYNVAHRCIATIHENFPQTGYIVWDTKKISSGVYFYQIILTINNQEIKKAFKKFCISK